MSDKFRHSSCSSSSTSSSSKRHQQNRQAPLNDAFALSDSCPRCRVSGCVRDFANWRAAALRQAALRDAHGGVWSAAAVIDSRPGEGAATQRCLCPFTVSLAADGCCVWRPASQEAAHLLLAQSRSLGVDLNLRLSGTPKEASLTLACHAFLLGSFLHTHGTGDWPPGCRLIRADRRLTLELDSRRYSRELLQFVFYSAYGHVISLGDNQWPTCHELRRLRAVVAHLTGQPDSVCHRLVDVPGLLANIVVLLDQLVGRFSPTEQAGLTPDLAALLGTSHVFDDLRHKLIAAVRETVDQQLDSAGAQLSQMHCHCHKVLESEQPPCYILDLTEDLLRELLLPPGQGADDRNWLDSALPRYLGNLVSLHEVNRWHAMAWTCRDLRCLAGILSLLETPCSERCSEVRSLVAKLCCTLVQLLCDRVVLNLADALCSGASQDETQNIVVTNFRCTAALGQSMLHILSQLGDSQNLSSELLLTLRSCLFLPEVESLMQYPRASTSLDNCRHSVAQISSRELRGLAFASYTAGRQPQMKPLVQAVALLLGIEQPSEPKKGGSWSQEEQQQSLCSEGRQILCAEGRLVSLVHSFSTEGALARLLTRSELWKWLQEFAGPGSRCSQGDRPACPDHGQNMAACRLFGWVRGATRCTVLLQTASEVFPTRDALRHDIVRVTLPHRQLVAGQAEELLASGDMTDAAHDALVSLVDTAAPASDCDGRKDCGAIDPEDRVAIDGEACAATDIEACAATDIEARAATDGEDHVATDVETCVATDVEACAATNVETCAATNVETCAATDVEACAATDVETCTATDVEACAANDSQVRTAADGECIALPTQASDDKPVAEATSTFVKLMPTLRIEFFAHGL